MRKRFFLGRLMETCTSIFHFFRRIYQKLSVGAVPFFLMFFFVSRGMVPDLATAQVNAEPPQLFRFVEGIDTKAQPFHKENAKANLNDPLGSILVSSLEQGRQLPNSIAELVKGLQDEGFTDSQNFLIGEGGQIPVDENSQNVERGFRVVLARGKPGGLGPILINIPAASRQGFIEAMAWDPRKAAFNYYRRQEGRTWVWKGDSGHAVQRGTAGKSCFQCHVNGAPIMKELNRPWNNWHSQSAAIPDEAVPRSSPLLRDPFLKNLLKNLNDLDGAERLQTEIVEVGIHKVIENRLSSLLEEESGSQTNVHRLISQLFLTTSINLTSSEDISRGQSPKVSLPRSFFLNLEILGPILNLGDMLQTFQPSVSRNTYEKVLAKYNFVLTNGGTFSQPGETFFAFFVPEASAEDIKAVEAMLAHNVLSEKFVASVLMVDFPNPVYSRSRASLFQYVPKGIKTSEDLKKLPERFVTSVAKKTIGGCRHEDVTKCLPEQQFLYYWRLPENKWKKAFRDRLSSYFEAIQIHLNRPQSFDAIMRLAESRRQQLRAAPHKKLIESPFLFARNNIPKSPALNMRGDATVHRMP